MGFPCNWSREVLEVSRDQDYRAQYYGQIWNSKAASLNVGNCENKHMFSFESTDWASETSPDRRVKYKKYRHHFVWDTVSW